MTKEEFDKKIEEDKLFRELNDMAIKQINKAKKQVEEWNMFANLYIDTETLKRLQDDNINSKLVIKKVEYRNEKNFWNNEDVLEFYVKDNLIFTALQFGENYHCWGKDVYTIEQDDYIDLTYDDLSYEFIQTILMLRKYCINIKLNSKVETIEKKGD